MRRCPRALLILLTLALALYTFRIGNIGLWADEGETLALAQNTLEHGFPTVHGQNHSLCERLGAPQSGAWTAQPWVQFYLAALGVAVFGKSVAMLRLLFALFGVVSVAMVWQLCAQLRLSEKIQWLATLLMAVNVPVILLARNVRYYPLLPFFALWLLILYLDARAGKNRWLAFGLVSTLFMHTHQPIAAAVLVSIFAHAAIYERRKRFWRELLQAQLLMLALVLPWLVALWPGLVRYYEQRAPSALGKNTSATDTLLGAVLYLQHLIRFNFPLLLLVPYGILRLRVKKTAAISREALLLLVLVILAQCLAMAYLFNSNLWPGYLIAAIPFCCMLSACLIDAASLNRRALLIGISAVVILSTTLNLPFWPLSANASAGNPQERRLRHALRGFVQPELSFLLPKYLGEIFHTYRGPVAATVEYLKMHATKGDRVFVTNDRHSIAFLSGLQTLENLPFASPPEWIIRRGKSSWGNGVCENLGLDADQYVATFLKEHRYEVIVLDAPNLYHENEPILPFHHFETPQIPDKVTLLHRAPE